MSRTYVLAESQGSYERIERQGDLVSRIWIKTRPLTQQFCQRVAQLQLQTESCDHAQVTVTNNWRHCWFEICILASEDAKEPKRRGERVLSWRSHSNTTASQDFLTHFGIIFDRKSQLLDDLEVGDVLAVRVCAHSLDWENYTKRGTLTVRELNEDLFSPEAWNLKPVDTPGQATESLFTLQSMRSCEVRATDDTLVSKVWLESPPLGKDDISRIQTIQLSTVSRGLGTSEFSSNWSWFDIMILDSPGAETPKVVNGVSLVWKSHHNSPSAKDYEELTGEILFWDNPLLFLDEGNVVAVRVCAQFRGWGNCAKEGRLVIGINKIETSHPPEPTRDLKRISKSVIDLRTEANEALAEASLLEATAIPNEPAPAYSSPSNDLILQQGIRADHIGCEAEPPLRLLSLDGGGVRGISALVILKEIMEKVTSDKNARPCDYFDMIAGTSTGGLIALMLGRLRMTIDECMKEYEGLSREVFTRGRLGKLVGVVTKGARYDATVLKNGIQDLLKRRLGDSETPMLENDPLCKVLLMASRSDCLNNRTATYLRTYDCPNAPPQDFPPFKIWEAARASSAAPTFFEEVQLGKYTFVDGGLGFNNPVQELVNEAYFLYGAKRPIGCIVSIGTGLGKDVALGPISVVGVKHWVRGIVSVASGSERQHERMIANSLRLPPVGEQKYFRFNVGEKDCPKWVNENTLGALNEPCGTTVDMLEENHFKARHIQLDDCERMLEFAELSRRYMAGKEQQKLARRCAKRLYRTTLAPTEVSGEGQDQGTTWTLGSGQQGTSESLQGRELSSQTMNKLIEEEDQKMDKNPWVTFFKRSLSSELRFSHVKRRRIMNDYASVNLNITSSHALEDHKKNPTKVAAKFYSFEWRARETRHDAFGPDAFRQLLVHTIKSREWVPSWVKVNSRAFRETFSIMIFFVATIVLIKLLITLAINDVNGMRNLPIMIRSYSYEKASVGGRSLTEI